MVSAEEDLDQFEAEIELALYQEYRAVLPMFRYVVETERRFYLANEVTVTPHENAGATHFEVELGDAWVWPFPTGSFRLIGACGDVQGRQRRGATREGHLTLRALQRR